MKIEHWWLALSLFASTGLGETVLCPTEPGKCFQEGNPHASDISVYSTSVVNCSFDNGFCCYRQGCVDNGMGNWTTSNGSASAVQRSNPHCAANQSSILESHWVNYLSLSCVEFKFYTRSPYKLNVFLTVNNGTQPSLIADSLRFTDQANQTVRFAIQPLTGKIQFRASGGGDVNKASFLRLYYVRITEGDCTKTEGSEPSDPSQCEEVATPLPEIQSSTPRFTTYPSYSSTDSWSSPKSPGTRPHASSSPSSSHHPVTSTRSFSSSPTSSTTDTMFSESPSSANDEDGTNIAAIVGASVAAVTVTAVVVFVLILVYRRKFGTRNTDGEESRIIGRSTRTEDRGYVNIVAAGSPTQTTVFNADVKSDDPYELAEDGVPGQTRNSFTDTYNFIPEDHDQPNGTLDDDYSRVDDVQRPAAGSSGKNDTQATQDCKDVYSVVNKPGRKPASPAEYSLAKIVDEKPALPNPNDVYSVVNKKGKKPTIAPKPGTSDAEYNTTSHTGRSTTKQGPGDATADTYNRIGAVPSLGPNGQIQESTADEYNTLDFADARQNASRKEKSGAYDHVSNNPDDSGYSKTRIGERNVVIDSEYHHLQA